MHGTPIGVIFHNLQLKRSHQNTLNIINMEKMLKKTEAKEGKTQKYHVCTRTSNLCYMQVVMRRV